jgi:hypothetical protein
MITQPHDAAGGWDAWTDVATEVTLGQPGEADHWFAWSVIHKRQPTGWCPGLRIYRTGDDAMVACEDLIHLDWDPNRICGSCGGGVPEFSKMLFGPIPLCPKCAAGYQRGANARAAAVRDCLATVAIVAVEPPGRTGEVSVTALPLLLDYPNALQKMLKLAPLGVLLFGDYRREFPPDRAHGFLADAFADVAEVPGTLVDSGAEWEASPEAPVGGDLVVKVVEPVGWGIQPNGAGVHSPHALGPGPLQASLGFVAAEAESRGSSPAAPNAPRVPWTHMVTKQLTLGVRAALEPFLGVPMATMCFWDALALLARVQAWEAAGEVWKSGGDAIKNRPAWIEAAAGPLVAGTAEGERFLTSLHELVGHRLSFEGPRREIVR